MLSISVLPGAPELLEDFCTGRTIIPDLPVNNLIGSLYIQKCCQTNTDRNFLLFLTINLNMVFYMYFKNTLMKYLL